MIVLITEWHQPVDKTGTATGPKMLVVSHGIDRNTFKNVVMPQEPPEKIPGAFYNQLLGEWCLRE